MKDKRHIQSFNEHQENLNISDVSDSKNFIPTKDMWYIFFNFYINDQDEINRFKNDLKNKYNFILGFVEDTGMFGSKRLLVYVSSEEEVKKLKNNETLKLYQKYVGDGGYNVR